MYTMCTGSLGLGPLVKKIAGDVLSLDIGLEGVRGYLYQGPRHERLPTTHAGSNPLLPGIFTTSFTSSSSGWPMSAVKHLTCQAKQLAAYTIMQDCRRSARLQHGFANISTNVGAMYVCVYVAIYTHACM